MLISAAISELLFGSPRRLQRAETLTDRLTAVAHIRVSPGKFVGYEGEGVMLTAHPTDYQDRTVQGVRFSWESSNTDKVQIDDTGRARFLQPGLAVITCRAGSAEASARILVKPSHRPRQTDQEWRADQASLQANADPSTSTGGTGSTLSLASSLLNSLSPTAQAQGSWLNDLAYDQLWNEPRNLVGSPRNRAIEPTAIGTVMPEGSNFNWSVPLLNLSGRGLDLSLSLYYNSRVWSRRNNQLAFDAISGWPAPGFSMGFGRIVAYDVGSGGNPTCKYMLVDPDGTRHYLGSGLWGGGAYAGGPFETSDGTHIVYTGNARDGGDLHYPDGTTVSFYAINNRLLPAYISDRSGNYIQIAYKSIVDEFGGGTAFAPLALDYIIDTLGRRIEFQYDSTGKLISITRPGFNGTSTYPITQTLVQFDYQTLWASTNFTGLTVERGSPGYCLKHIYFPATGTGYKPSYSEFGMIYNVSMRRQMTSSSWPPGNPPAITDGVESASVAFNYPTSAQTALTDVPAFTQRTESAVNSPTAVYGYSASTDSSAQTVTFQVSRPDTSVYWMMRDTNASHASNGLVLQSGVYNQAATVLTYVNDPGGSIQVQSVISYDETGTPIKVDFDYDQYGNVTNKREYGYQVGGAWQVRRRTHYTYKTDSGYIALYLRSLVTLVELFDALQNTNDADDALIAKSSYAYDNFVAMGGIENYGGTASPPGHINITPSGKVTGVTEWVDFAVPTPTVIQRLAKIDIFGNVVKAQVSCCQEKDLTIRDVTYWAHPSEETSGDPNGVHQTTSTDYDFNTSLAKSYTNAAGLVSNFSYDAMMTPAGITLPTGAGSQRSTDYATLSSTSSVTYDDGGVTKTLTSTTSHDGWGRVIQTVDPNNAQVNTAYDAMGKVTSRTNPFTAGGTPGPSTTTQYDLANHAVITTLPDGNTMRTDYSGATVTATDQVGRKMKRDRDGLGRLVKVTEQDATGALTQETSYTYNLLDKVTLVNQGNQQRRYKYDALGRLLFERIPEQSATINDGTGTYWSTKYTYTEFSALSTKQDARGVVTTYGYDSLHRMNSISYDTSSASGVASTPSVSLSYDTAGALSGVTVGNQFTETYSFDTYHRAQSVTRWILGQANDSRKTYTTSYEYNQASQLTKITYPSSFHFNPSYDDKGRPAALLYDKEAPWQGGYMTNVSYNIAGQVSGLSLGNGVAETYSYDSQRLQMTGQTATKSGNTLMNLTYGYQATAGQNGANTTAGNNGQLMSVTGAINSTTESAAYSYDLLGRLATSNQTSNGVSGQRRFAYDRWGNRTGVWNATSGGTQIQSFNLEQSGGAPTNRITSVTNSGVTSNYTYDAAGNVTNDGLHAYQYDAENRVVSVDSGSALYRYDHLNRRVCKIIGTSWTHYIYEGSQCISEHDGTQGYTTNPSYQVSSARVDYVYSGSRMIYRRQRASSSGTWAANYYLSDRLSARLVLDTGGNVVGSQAHLPFGEDFAESGTQEKHHFTSYERDSESNLDYAVNRGYSTGMGRFNQADPYKASGYMVNPQSWNRYNYVQNNPVDAFDPLGLDSVPISKVFLLPGGGIAVGTCTEARCFWDIRLVPISENEPRPVEFDPCPDRMKRFFSNIDIYKKMAETLKIDVTFLLALSSVESGWLNDHNAGLHNLFGVTHAGGNNLRYPSYQAAADDWIARFGQYVSGAETMDAFVEGLRKVPPNGYNTVTPNYYNIIKNQVQYVKKWAEKCNVDLTPS